VWPPGWPWGGRECRVTMPTCFPLIAYWPELVKQHPVSYTGSWEVFPYMRKWAHGFMLHGFWKQCACHEWRLRQGQLPAQHLAAWQKLSQQLSRETPPTLFFWKWTIFDKVNFNA
jgi:hypothetical protein